MLQPQSMTLSIKMFGAFRKYHPDTLEVIVPAGSQATVIKAAIGAALRQKNPTFNDDELLGKSVLADHQQILGADDVIAMPATLAILPPVCGG